MPRFVRIVIEGVAHHIVQRGNSGAVRMRGRRVQTAKEVVREKLDLSSFDRHVNAA
jgi:hypothetical protein